MKKSVVFVALIVLFIPKIKAQPYHSLFGKDSTRWQVVLLFDPNTFKEETYTAIKDTIVNNYQYKKVVSSYHGYNPILLREDTLQGKVWLRDYVNDTLMCGLVFERLLMDLSLSVGDSFFLFYTFRKVDSVYHDAAGRKHVRFDWNFSSAFNEKFEFIEEVGAIMGPGIAYCPGVFGWMDLYMLCAWKDGTQIYSNKHFNGDCYPYEVLSTKDDKVNKNEIDISPNPVTDKLQITGTRNNMLRYSIINSMGAVVLKSATENTDIDVSLLPPGLYTLILQQSTSSVVRKFIKQ